MTETMNCLSRFEQIRAYRRSCPLIIDLSMKGCTELRERRWSEDVLALREGDNGDAYVDSMYPIDSTLGINGRN